MAGSPATLLVVSHDRRLLETVCEKLWVVDDGAAAPFDGGYRAWRAAVAGGWTVAAALEEEAKRLRGGGRRVGPPRREAGSPDVDAQLERHRRRAPRATGAAVAAKPRAAQDREALEGRLSQAEDRARRRATRGSACARTTSSSPWATRRSTANFVEMRRVTSELADVDAALAAAEDAWLELEERAP